MLLSLFFLMASKARSDVEPEAHSLDSSDIYDSYELTYLNESDLEILNEIGRGRFSQVYRARLPDGRIVAAKYLKPTESWRLKREVKFMELLRGSPNVIDFIGLYGDDRSPILVTELGVSDRRTLVSLPELKWAMHALFSALNATHSRNVFHRDIKWQNLLVSFGERRLRLIDWGLAEHVIPGRKLPSRVGTTCYKAPELLLGFKFYGPEVDIWAAGVTMADLMFGCPTFFPAVDDDEVLTRHTQVFGDARLSRIAGEYEWRGTLGYHPGNSFVEFALPHTRALFTHESLDLLGKLLVPEREQRITANDVLEHPFFASGTF
jgi:casein kinase II subunit alpha